jgi:hypothetical protein
MRNAKGFQTFVQNIVKKWNASNPSQNFNLLEQDEDKLKNLIIHNPTSSLAPLEITQLKPNLTFVAQPLQSDGAVDPGVALLTLHDRWYATGIQQLGFSYRCYVTASHENWHWKIHRLNSYRFNDLNSFCNQFWLRGLRAQGFGKLTKNTLRGSCINLIYAEWWNDVIEWEQQS